MTDLDKAGEPDDDDNLAILPAAFEQLAFNKLLTIIQAYVDIDDAVQATELSEGRKDQIVENFLDRKVEDV